MDYKGTGIPYTCNMFFFLYIYGIVLYITVCITVQHLLKGIITVLGLGRKLSKLEDNVTVSLFDLF